ncbi:chemokine-like protein TAFA-5 [Xiphias gladius]|uniref:chemokine-like protein TAFA-5 n=1 Tax=Xiphias gladius TaxID=8245 RepID=UPI001A99DE3C|nr:chemokine-like protein TAFA-5 [Xiphias gladius]
MQLLRLAWALTAAAVCFLLLLLLHNQILREGQLAAGTCEIVTLDRDSSQPRRTIARQTARCACRKGQIAGTTRARPACVDVRIVRSRQWCEMSPCLDDEGCDLLVNQSGWTCTQPGGRVKTTTVLRSHPLPVIDPAGPSGFGESQSESGRKLCGRSCLREGDDRRHVVSGDDQTHHSGTGQGSDPSESQGLQEDMSRVYERQTLDAGCRSPDSGGEDRRSPEKDWFPSSITHHR